jgi:hypothetical protein
MNKKYTTILGVALIILSILVLYSLFSFWPSDLSGAESKSWSEETNYFNNVFELKSEQRVLLLVMLSGALGSLIHVTSSFSNFVGNQKLDISWSWWYILRPFIAMGIALIFYMIFRGGLFTSEMEIEKLNLYGTLSISALSGMFSDRATLKLEEMFESIFKPRDDRKDKIND